MPSLCPVPPSVGCKTSSPTGTHATHRPAGLPTLSFSNWGIFSFSCLESFVDVFYFFLFFFFSAVFWHSIRNILAYVLGYRHQELSYVNEDRGGQSWESRSRHCNSARAFSGPWGECKWSRIIKSSGSQIYRHLGDCSARMLCLMWRCFRMTALFFFFPVHTVVKTKQAFWEGWVFD